VPAFSRPGHIGPVELTAVVHHQVRIFVYYAGKMRHRGQDVRKGVGMVRDKELKLEMAKPRTH
jgi:hypothetical protein